MPVNRGWNGNDMESGFSQIFLIAGKENVGIVKFTAIQFMTRIDIFFHQIDPLCINVETYDFDFFCKGKGNGQSDISKADQ